MKKYEAVKGFYDLSKKPKSLTKKEHKQIQDIQMMLIRVDSRDEKYIEDKTNWRKAQELSAKLQQLIFRHYETEPKGQISFI